MLELKTSQKKLTQKTKNNQPDISNGTTSYFQRGISQLYDVRFLLTLTNKGPGKVELLKVFTPLFKDIEPYQEMIDIDPIEPSSFEIESDSSGNRYKVFDFLNVLPGRTSTVKFKCKIKANEIRYNILGFDREKFPISKRQSLQPEKYIESDHPHILSLAQQFINQTKDNLQALKNIYVWVLEKILDRKNKLGIWANANDDGALFAVQQYYQAGYLDFTDLFIALCRACGMRAICIKGLSYRTKPYPLGIWHWAEVFIPPIGWVPFDPAWDALHNERFRCFGGLSADHIGLLRGRNTDYPIGFTYRYWSDKELTLSEDGGWYNLSFSGGANSEEWDW